MDTIAKFYNNPSWKQPHNLEIKIAGYNDTFTLDLMGGNQKPDCCIGHFGYNFYFRTNKGVKSQKYKTLKSCFHAIKRKLKDKFQGVYIVHSFNKKRIF